MRVIECTKRLAWTAFFCPDGCFRPTRRSHSRSFSGAKGVPLIHPPLSLSPPLVDLWVPQVLQQLWDVNWLMGMQDRGGLIMALSTLFFFSACGAPEKKPASRTSPSEAPTTSTADASADRRELNEHKEEPSLLRRMGSFRRRGATASDAEMTGVRRQTEAEMPLTAHASLFSWVSFHKLHRSAGYPWVHDRVGQGTGDMMGGLGKDWLKSSHSMRSTLSPTAL